MGNYIFLESLYNVDYEKNVFTKFFWSGIVFKGSRLGFPMNNRNNNYNFVNSRNFTNSRNVMALPQIL